MRGGNSLRGNPTDAANQFIRKYFPKCDVAFLAGSVLRGEGTDSSDLDIVVIDPNYEPYRESFVEHDWKIECFVHNHESVTTQFSSDKEKGRPILASMIFEGLVIKDQGDASLYKEKARLLIERGPAPLTKDFIQASRYYIFDLLDDFIDSENEHEALLTLNTLSVQLAEFILRSNGQWTGRGKTLTRALHRYDSALAGQYFHALDCYYRNRDKEAMKQFVHQIYAPIGGPLFAGFRSG